MEQMHVGTISDDGKPSHYVKAFWGDITAEKVTETLVEMLGQGILVYTYIGIDHPLKHFLPEDCHLVHGQRCALCKHWDEGSAPAGGARECRAQGLLRAGALKGRSLAHWWCPRYEAREGDDE